MNAWWRARPSRHSQKTWPCVLGLLAIPIIGIGNYYSGPEFSFVIFYLPMLALVGWLGGSAMGALAGIESALAGFVADWHVHRAYSDPAIPYWNGGARALVFISFGLLFAILRQHREYLRHAVAQTTAELQKEIAERSRIQREVADICAEQQRQIGYDLHDGVGQQLSGIAFKSKLLEHKLQREGSVQASEAGAITRLINDALRQTRMISHSMEASYGEAVGLRAALYKLGEELTESEQVRAIVNIDETAEVPAPADSQLFRIAQEAVRNATTHGNASRIEINLESGDGAIFLRVRDDGSGFDGTPAGEGMGMRTMQYRAQTIGGSLEISSSSGGGTLVTCRVPMTPSANGHGSTTAPI